MSRFGNWGGTLLVTAVVLAALAFVALPTLTGFAVAVGMLVVAVVVLYYAGVAIDNWLRHGGPLQ